MKNLKKQFLTFAGIGVVLVLSSCTINKPQSYTRKVSVKGTGTAYVDQMVLTFNVKTREIEMDMASKKNADIFSKIQALLLDSGIEEKDISTSTTTDKEKANNLWVKIEDGSWIQIEFYNIVNNEITVTLKNVTKAKVIKEAVLQADPTAVTLKSVRYIPSDPASSLRQARTNAVQVAQDSANLLAGASSCKVSNVLEIVEEKTTYEKTNARSIILETMPGSVTTVSEGTVSVTTEVTIVYSLMD